MRLSDLQEKTYKLALSKANGRGVKKHSVRMAIDLSFRIFSDHFIRDPHDALDMLRRFSGTLGNWEGR